MVAGAASTAMAEPGGDAAVDALIEALEHPPLVTKRYLIPEGAYSPPWMIEKKKEEWKEDPDFEQPEDPDVELRPPMIKERMNGFGVVFPEGASATRESDPSPRYDWLVAHNSEAALARIGLVIDADVGVHVIAGLRIFRQLELTRALRDDLRNLKHIDYSEFAIPPMVEFLLKARHEATAEIPGLRGMAAHPTAERVWKEVDRFVKEDPEDPRAVRVTSIESVLREELDQLRERLVNERRRLASMQLELEALAKRQRENDPFAE